MGAKELWEIVGMVLLGTSPLLILLIGARIEEYRLKYGIDEWTMWYGPREEILKKKRKYKERHKKEK